MYVLSAVPTVNVQVVGRVVDAQTSASVATTTTSARVETHTLVFLRRSMSLRLSSTLGKTT